LTTRRPSDAQSLVGAMSACSGHRAAGSVEADASAPGIEHAAPASCCIVPVWRGYDLCPYQVVVIRVAHVRGEGCAAALFVGNLDEAVTGSAAEVAMLRTTFGLTAAEARLALRLAAGSTLADAADAFGVTQNTVRAQLRAVFDKTGARRQSELVRLLNGWRTLKLRLD
jgi:DNA-binding CsgD family transcriptional regulator